jgi:hypothetical protein
MYYYINNNWIELLLFFLNFYTLNFSILNNLDLC